jgi:ribosomal protein S27AE
MTSCPECGAVNAIRASNDPSYIYCGSCGWVEDPDHDGGEDE